MADEKAKTSQTGRLRQKSPIKAKPKSNQKPCAKKYQNISAARRSGDSISDLVPIGPRRLSPLCFIPEARVVQPLAKIGRRNAICLRCRCPNRFRFRAARKQGVTLALLVWRRLLADIDAYIAPDIIIRVNAFFGLALSQIRFSKGVVTPKK